MSKNTIANLHLSSWELPICPVTMNHVCPKTHTFNFLCSVNFVSAVFASLVQDFAGPTKDDIIDYFELDENNAFSMCLGFLSSAIDSFENGHSPLSEVLHLTSNLQVCTDHRQQLYA